MNQNQFEGMWHQLKGQVKQQWGKLTDDEIEHIAGHAEELSGTLQRKYGYTKEKAEQEIESFMETVKHH